MGKTKRTNKHIIKSVLRGPINYWRRGSWFRKTWLTLITVLVVSLGGMYGIARWYIAKHSHETLQMGVTFSPDYARALGLDPKPTMQAMVSDLGVRRFRLVSYWNDIE